MPTKDKGGNGRKGGNGKKRPGAPGVYDPERIPELARALALAGHTEAETAYYLGVTAQTIQQWKAHHAEFAVALQGGKDPVNEQVEKSLYQRAIGYEYEETTIIGVPGPDGGMIVQRVIKTKKREPPNPTACIYWTKNRMPDRWRDVNRFEGKIEKTPYSGTSDAELAAIGKQLFGNGHDKGEAEKNE